MIKVKRLRFGRKQNKKFHEGVEPSLKQNSLASTKREWQKDSAQQISIGVSAHSKVK